MTTALDITFGELAENLKYLDLLEKMMREVKELAGKFNVTLTEKDIEEALAMFKTFPYRSKSSLQLDFENQNIKTEKDILADYVIINGKILGINVYHYEEMTRKITEFNYKL